MELYIYLIGRITLNLVHVLKNDERESTNKTLLNSIYFFEKHVKVKRSHEGPHVVANTTWHIKKNIYTKTPHFLRGFHFNHICSKLELC